MSVSALEAAATQVAREYPAVEVHGVVGDFTRQLDLLPGGEHRLLAFLGGTLGNLLPEERSKFLADARATLVPGEHLLLGVGLVTDPAVMVPAYDDAAGITAQFNRNVLHVLNRELGADFVPDAFDHVARWDAEHEWIEMRLRASRDMHVYLADLDLDIDLAAGEDILTEVSAKFRVEGISAELAAAGFEVATVSTDADERFALLLARAT